MVGQYWIIDGPDGAGKTTAIASLRGTVDVDSYKFVVEPTVRLRAILADSQPGSLSNSELVGLFADDRSCLVREELIPFLAQGSTVVVSDRGFPSSLVYQSDGVGSGGLAVNDVVAANGEYFAHLGMFGITPRVVILDPGDDVCEDRLRSRGDNDDLEALFEGTYWYRQRVRSRFRELARSFGWVVVRDAEALRSLFVDSCSGS